MPSLRKQVATTAVRKATLETIPYDVLEHILHHIDSREDLLSFALLNTYFRDITIPRHLEYRRIQISLSNQPVWMHLAERPDLASNVRTLIVETPRVWFSTLPWRVPRTLVQPSTFSRSPGATGALSGYGVIEQAVSNMKYLQSIELCLYRVPSGPSDTMCSILSYCAPSVQHLTVCASGYGAGWSILDELPVWALSNLESIVLPGITHIYSLNCLPFIFVSSATLQVLHLPGCVGRSESLAAQFAECRFPALRELTLGPSWTFSNGTYGANFLNVHPTIQVLSWDHTYLVPLSAGALPALKSLTFASWPFFGSVIRTANGGTLALESLDCRKRILCIRPRHLPFLSQVEGSTLRQLAIFCEEEDVLKEIAFLFPSLTHLTVWGRISDLGRRPRASGRSLKKLISVPFRGQRYPPHYDPPVIGQSLALFPKLEVLGGLQFMNYSHMNTVLSRYPRLVRFDSPRFSQ
ncbi:hypothetical protein BV25DRAFT_299267 [Artomyces pyxidatus]|uniref:Uncharacterized protein n=1 Tax=Artomyces pyxidatus TaxID=48021 RepID=A0ACB8T7X9_9AGAM|nr:hypothetical protein BV25DRAFT_299267 [Artomyces pyxidatus]